MESFFNNFLNEARGKAEKELNLVKFKPKNKNKGKGKELFCTHCKTNTYLAKDCWHLHHNLAFDFWDPKKAKKGGGFTQKSSGRVEKPKNNKKKKERGKGKYKKE